MRRTVAILGFVAIVAACTGSFLVLPSGASRAGTTTATFLIPATDGYGVADCLASGTECGKVIATAWCEAQGFARADAFGPAQPEDATGSVDTARPPEAAAISITCGN